MIEQINVICGIIVDGDKIYCEKPKKDNIFDLWSFISAPVFDFEQRFEVLKEKVRKKLKAEIIEIEEFEQTTYSQISMPVVTYSYICKISPNYKIPRSCNGGFYSQDEIRRMNLTPVHYEIFSDYIEKYPKN